MQAARSLLEKQLLESPVLVIALLDALPSQRRHVRTLLSAFLDDYEGRAVESAADLRTSPRRGAFLPMGDPGDDAVPATRAFRVRTPLNHQLKGTERARQQPPALSR